MKVILTIAAASFVLTTGGVQAQNDPVLGAAGRAPTIVFAADARQFTQADGVFLTVEGRSAWVIDHGKKVAAPDGDHVLADGKVITVKNGQVAGALPESGVANPAGADPAVE